MTAKQLRGRAFRPLFRGVFVAADVEVTYWLLCEGPRWRSERSPTA